MTIINKEHGRGARDANVQVITPGFLPKSSAKIDLTTRQRSVGATDGITLGGGIIANNTPWKGMWSESAASKEGCQAMVPSGSATVIKLSR